MYTLHPKQKEAVDRMVAEPTKACLLASGLGTGKTLKVVETCKALGAKTILIIAPVNTEDGWKATFEKQEIGVPFLKIDSSVKGKKNFGLLKAKTPGVYFIGREFFGLSGTKGPNKKVKDDEGNVIGEVPGRAPLWSWKTVIPDVAAFDEVHSAGNKHSVTFRALRQLKAHYKIAASATPQGNKFENMWTISRWLWPTLIDSAQSRWILEWCKTEYSPFTSVNVVGEKNPGAFVTSLPCYIRQEREETPMVKRKVKVDLSPRQRAMYDQMERDALTWLSEQDVLVADVPIVQRMRMRQITLGEVTFNDAGEVDFDIDCESSKLDALAKIIRLHPDEPMLILVDSAKFVKVVVDRIGKGAVAWTGATKQADRDRYKAEFGSSVQYIVATIPSISEGTDGLQEKCHIEVWLSKSLNNMHNEQVAGRLNRTGQKADEIISYEVMARESDDDSRFEKLRQQTIATRNSLKAKEAS